MIVCPHAHSCRCPPQVRRRWFKLQTERGLLEPAVEAKLHELEATMQRVHGGEALASTYGHVSQVLTCSRERGVPATLAPPVHTHTHTHTQRPR